MLPLAIMAVLWWSSSRPPTPRRVGPLGAFLHNGMHAVAFGALAGACLLALLGRDTRIAHRRRWLVASFAIAVGYGVVDEMHQSFVPGRICSIADMATDAAGALLVLVGLRGVALGRPASRRVLVGMAMVAVACAAFATWGPL
ncbi:MAG: VanZ family protein [Planctomycetes bacterium]|nr:VanZ family protein [Planctomycetota bacterium]